MPTHAGTNARGSDRALELPEARTADGARLLGHLQAEGFAVLNIEGGIEQFERRSHSLGRVVDVTDVHLIDGGRTYLSRSGPVPFHTDHPSIAWIGWLCLAQDEVDGSNLLIDTRALLGAMGDEAEKLRDIRIGCPDLQSTRESYEHPLLWTEGRGVRVYWSPWRRLAAPTSTAAALALDRFITLVDEAPADARASVRLQPQQALYIDNGRMLHGRAAIHPASPRRLLRHWIVIDGERDRTSRP